MAFKITKVKEKAISSAAKQLKKDIEKINKSVQAATAKIFEDVFHPLKFGKEGLTDGGNRVLVLADTAHEGLGEIREKLEEIDRYLDAMLRNME